MDLFRHTTQLGQHQQSAIGYAHWVCKTLLQSQSNALTYSIHNMYAVSVACDALTWYTGKRYSVRVGETNLIFGYKYHITFCDMYSVNVGRN